MGKKAVKLSMAEACAKFGGDAMANAIPTQSVGKDYGKAKGKGLREFEDNRAERDMWRGGDGGKGGFGKGRDRDEKPSRADEGDWFSKDDRPSGGGFRRGGDRDGGRDGGGGGGRRGPDRETAADGDGDWRAGPRRDEDGDRPPRRGGLGERGDRDRGGRGDDGDWRGGSGGGGGRGGREEDRENRPSERPKLNLKPRSKPVDGEATSAASAQKSDPFGGARSGAARDDAPKSRSEPEEKKPADDGDWETVKRPTTSGQKYRPPQRQVEDEDRRRDDDGSRRRVEEDEGKRPGGGRFDDSRPARGDDRRRDDRRDEGRRPEPRDDRPSAGGSKYVPPAQKKEEMARRAKEEEKFRREEEEAAEKARKEEEAKQAEREKKAAAKAKKEAEKAEAKARMEGRTTKDKDKETAKDKEDQSKKKVEAFGEKCVSLIDDQNADVEDAVDDCLADLTHAEFSTVQPLRQLLQPLMQYCRRKTDEEVVEAVGRFAPLLSSLIEKAEVRRFKLKVLCEAQRIASQMGLPRLSPASALVEVFFDGLYQAEIIEEDYFSLWAMSDDDTPGKTSAMFQLNDFLEWLRKDYDSEEEGEGEEGEGSGDEDEDEDEEDDDIEANIPKRAGATRPAR